MNSFILKGDICYCKEKDSLLTFENSYLVCEDSLCKGVYKTIPEHFSDLPIYDYSDKLILPGLVDLHIHAPQFAFRSLNMDLELLSWLNESAFKEEAKYSDLSYAQKAYYIFSDSLKNSATTRACIFATLHKEATKSLFELMESTGLVSFTGKVNMDRNSPPELCEKSAKTSITDTISFIEETIGKYKNTSPIITPRFIPSCSDELLINLGEIAEKYNLPVQSHLSENKDEIKWVKELVPDALSYGHAYDKFGLFGKSRKTVMAHCVYSSDDEVELIKQNEVFIAHCPASNTNLSSGIAPIRKYIEKGLKVGLGSDVAGGHTESLFRAISDTIQVSKLYHRLVDENCAPIKFSEAFFLATKGGGEFFGKVGSFEDGYEFDAVIIDDGVLPHPQKLSVYERLQRAVYLNADLLGVKGKFVRGVKIK